MIPPHGSVPMRWLWLALSDECAQEAALIDVEYPRLTNAARWELLTYRLAVLRHQVWDRYITPQPRISRWPGIRPSKLRRRTGYRRSKPRRKP